MAEILSPREAEDVSRATALAENGNGSRLRDLVHDDKDFAHHAAIINAMLNANQDHLQKLEIQQHSHSQTDSVTHISHLELHEREVTLNGQDLVKRSVTSDGRAIYQEVYNNTTKSWEDSGSCPQPTGFIPPFIEKKVDQ